jgi:hypothetical protein
MDFITSLPDSQGRTNMLVITDRLSKGVILEMYSSVPSIAVTGCLLRLY